MFPIMTSSGGGGRKKELRWARYGIHFERIIAGSYKKEFRIAGGGKKERFDAIGEGKFISA